MKKLLKCIEVILAVAAASLFLLSCQQKNAPAPAAAAQSVTVAATQETSADAAAESIAAESTAASASAAAEIQPAAASASAAAETQPATAAQTTAAAPDEDGWYYTKEDVALYIHTYGCLPDNFVTKKESKQICKEYGVKKLEQAVPGLCIGGDRFQNREGQLPQGKGRYYIECDIDYYGGSRGARRIVFSNDGLIFYTDDHYDSFEQLY